MCMTDPIADLITRIRNAGQSRQSECSVPRSNYKKHILDVLASEGYIVGFEDDVDNAVLRVKLKYAPSGQNVIRKIYRVSRPGRRFYKKRDELRPVRNGIGMAVLSTSRGVMSDIQARKSNLGGEVLFLVY